MKKTKKQKVVVNTTDEVLRRVVKKNAEVRNIEANRKLVEENKICGVCGEPLHIKWTVMHGEGYCQVCGVPYYMFKFNDKGIRERSLHCGAKPNIRTALRKIYFQYKNNLGAYSEEATEIPGFGTHSKFKMNTSVAKEAVVGGSYIPSDDMSPNDVLKCLESLEDRNFEDVDEDIKIIKGLGVLVTQKFNQNREDKSEPAFYSFDKLRKTLAILSAGSALSTVK